MKKAIIILAAALACVGVGTVAGRFSAKVGTVSELGPTVEETEASETGDTQVKSISASYNGRPLKVGETINKDDITVKADTPKGTLTLKSADWQASSEIGSPYSPETSIIEISYKGKKTVVTIPSYKEEPIETTVSAEVAAEPSAIYEQGESVSTLPSGSAKLIQGIVPLSQTPELATGCEIVSLTMALNYFGYPADKCDMADNYLDKGPVGETNFYKAFVGNPRENTSFGCYAPVIVNSAQKYIDANGCALTVENKTDSDFSELISEYVDKDIPVIIWATADCAQGHYSKIWHVEGRDMQWYTPEHCMLLIGYDTEKNTVSAADPLKGIIAEYDRDIFETRFHELHDQAVVLLPTNTDQ